MAEYRIELLLKDGRDCIVLASAAWFNPDLEGDPDNRRMKAAIRAITQISNIEEFQRRAIEELKRSKE